VAQPSQTGGRKIPSNAIHRSPGRFHAHFHCSDSKPQWPQHGIGLSRCHGNHSFVPTLANDAILISLKNNPYVNITLVHSHHIETNENNFSIFITLLVT